jgi:hypothetical protein
MWYPKCHRSLTLFNLVERLIAIRWMEPLEKMLPPHWCSCCYLSMALATNQSNNTTMSIAQSTADSSVFFLNIRLYVLNEDIRSNDVLFGGGGSEIENHHDTSQFLRVVLLWKRLYKATRSNERKTELAKRVVSTVSRNRGRFLRPADDIEAQELGIPTGVGMAQGW